MRYQPKEDDKWCVSSDYDEVNPIKIDIERMEKALKSESFIVPNGLTREQICEFILSKSRNH